ncbi:MAG TPA: FAD-dependent oxidoreductase [Panacibacter sp.]|nr:FAD-dependent oxidoreductase [Panacibacter sp.]
MHKFFLTMIIFDTIVVGKGLMGAAAAKYLGAAGQNIAIIGPDEPDDVNKATVFSSHYDQGRVQRIIGRDDLWTRLNLESASVYGQLQNQTGIEFHYGVGCLYVSLHKDDVYLQQLPARAEQFQFPINLFDNGAALQNAFPDFAFPAKAKGNFEASPSGHINPRKLIEAQLAVCKQQQATVINDTVVLVEKKNEMVEVLTETGKKYTAKKVLLCAGAFANFLQLMERRLALRLKSETVLLAKVSEAEAIRLAELPALLYDLKTDELEDIYLIRPLQYPDGNWYLKMGCNLATDTIFSSLEAIQHWFRQGNSDRSLKLMKYALHQLMPAIAVEEYFTKRCIITYTETKTQYIGAIDDAVYIATGGNGYSAMCSDAVGRIAAHVILYDQFPAPYKAEDFTPVWEAKEP